MIKLLIGLMSTILFIGGLGTLIFDIVTSVNAGGLRTISMGQLLSYISHNWLDMDKSFSSLGNSAFFNSSISNVIGRLPGFVILFTASFLLKLLIRK